MDCVTNVYRQVWCRVGLLMTDGAHRLQPEGQDRDRADGSALGKEPRLIRSSLVATG